MDSEHPGWCITCICCYIQTPMLLGPAACNQLTEQENNMYVVDS